MSDAKKYGLLVVGWLGSVGLLSFWLNTALDDRREQVKNDTCVVWEKLFELAGLDEAVARDPRNLDLAVFLDDTFGCHIVPESLKES